LISRSPTFIEEQNNCNNWGASTVVNELKSERKKETKKGKGSVL
jgi:hypothetical protein